MYLCLCKGLTERDVDRCMEAGHCTAKALVDALGLDDAGCCGRCRREVHRRGPAGWRNGALETVGAAGAGVGSVDGVSLIDLARASARPGAAERRPMCGLATCGPALCAACAARRLADPGPPLPAALGER